MGEWISVKDKMPEHNQEVIITGTSLENTFVHGAVYSKKWNCFYSTDSIRYDTSVTYWMPLPQPPVEYYNFA